MAIKRYQPKDVEGRSLKLGDRVAFAPRCNTTSPGVLVGDVTYISDEGDSLTITYLKRRSIGPYHAYAERLSSGVLLVAAA